jgi:hypothetical protein
MPLLLSLAIFFDFAVCGRATFCLLGVRVGHVRTWLLAPTAGLAVLSLMVMVLNQAGLPVATFARPLMAGTLLGAGWVLYRGQVMVPRALLPFGAIILLALLLGGWPALVHGFNWVGYGNDDMTNYCLMAQRSLHHGFYDIPTAQDLAGGDYSQYFWMLHVAGLIRFGSDQMVAYAAGVTDLATIRVFMPLLLAFTLTQLGAFMGLACSSWRRHKLALISGAILVVSPLWYLGTMYQLIAQVGGLAVLAAILALTARTHFPRHLLGQLRLAGASALLLAGLCIYYPELLPFYVIGWVLYMMLQMRSTHHGIKGLGPTVGLALLFVLVLLRHNVLSTVVTLLGQAQYTMNGAAKTNSISLFPYFLMPAGPAFFFGLDVIVSTYSEPIASLSLIGGFLAALGTLVLYLRGLRERTVSAIMLTGMILAGILFFISENGFSLFKLSMFSLPFVTIELAWLGGNRWVRHFAGVIVIFLLAIWLPGVWLYTKASVAGSSSAARELFDASASRGNLPLESSTVWSDITDTPVGKFLMLEKPSFPSAFMSQIVGEQLLGSAAKPFPDWVWRMMPGTARAQTAIHLVDYIQKQVYHGRTVFGLTFWSRVSTEQKPSLATILVTSTAEQHSFNKLSSHDFPPTDGIFNYTMAASLANYLIFIQTDEGQNFYMGTAGHIAVHKPEPDVYLPGHYFFAIGRHLLFRVLNPSDAVRIRLSLTASILGAGRTRLPTAAMAQYGDNETVPLGLVGAGSANVFSPPLHPLLINGASYVALDLGRDPFPLGLPATGLRGIYHRNLSIDTRMALGYCRDISVVSGQAYQALLRNRGISRFPDDLVGSHAVEYSGLYEDGWVSQHAFVMLGAITPGDKVVVSGMRPQIPGAKTIPQRVELSVDGVRLLSQALPPGHFTLEAPLGRTAPQVKIELHFDYDEALPAPDYRPVTVLLESIKIMPSS